MKKVLRAIGGFFARIGRWIANTAWIQPLLIVGGIFAIIFSIPYIKRGVEGLIAGNQVDSKEAYFKDRALSLKNAEKGDGESKVDTLFNYLEEDDYDSIKQEFGEKFFLTFAESNCANCKECVDGYTTLESRFNEYGLNKDEDGKDLPKFKHHAIMVDEIISDSSSEFDGKYLAKFVFENHQSLLDEIVAEYVDGSTQGDYAVFNNVSDSNREALKGSIEKLQNAIDNNGEGLDVPTTFLIDLTDEGLSNYFNVHGISAIFFNYTTLMTETINKETKGQFLRDCWSYQNIFDPDFKK